MKTENPSASEKSLLDEAALKFAPAIYKTVFQNAETRKAMNTMWIEKYSGKISTSDCIAKDAYELAESFIKERSKHLTKN